MGDFIPDRDLVPLSPCSFSFLQRTLNSPCLNVMTPCKLDSPFPLGDGAFNPHSWDQAAAAATSGPSMEEQTFDAGTWSNDLHEILVQAAHLTGQMAQTSTLAKPIPANFARTVAEMPVLSSYLSDGESPDNSPVSSDVEDSSPSQGQRQSTRRKLKRTFRELAEPVYEMEEDEEYEAAPVLAVARPTRRLHKSDASEDDEDSVVPLRECDANDEAVMAALQEDSPEAKLAAFPRVMEAALSKVRTSGRPGEDRTSLAINALLSAFTNDDKTGRPLPHSCQELLRIATEEVSQGRKQKREGKSQRRSLMQNQVESYFVCHAPGCNKQYTTAEGLRLHIRNHHEVDKKWACHAPDCTSERSFVRQADLRMHLIRMHSPIRPFPCRVPGCKKTFACHSELRRHIGTEHEDLVASLLRAATDN